MTQTLSSPPSLPAGAQASAAAGPSPAQNHLSFVVVGHVDHGKSTLIGRLLFDTHSVEDGKAERIQAACKAEGMEFEYAFLLDALLEEQAQNITMDTTRVSFRTPRRAYTIIDAPGHKEFLKNMITGAASADAAVLLVDANEGLREQTRRHGFLLSLLGLRQIVVAVNKMDLVGYDQKVFESIRSELGEFLGKLGVAPAHVVPVSAKLGEGLIAPSAHLSWYRGPVLLEALELFKASVPAVDAPLRLTVQDIYRFDARRIVAGLVETGTLSVGDPIVFSPGGKRSVVKTIETWPVPGAGAPAPAPVSAGRSVAVTLADELFVERGQVGSPVSDMPTEANALKARIFWLHNEPLAVGELVPLRLGAQKAEARILGIERTLDAVSLSASTGRVTEVKRHEVAEIRIRTRRPIAFDAGGRIPELGRFVLMRGGRIAGGGVIDEAIREDGHGAATPASRVALLGHRGAIVWLTGLSGSGKSTLAQELERRLLRNGTLATILDGDTLRAGLSRSLGFSPEDRRENLRRAIELAIHLAEAGVVVVAALISPFRADRAMIAKRAAERGIPFAEVYVNAPLEECERRDPKSLYKRARAGEVKEFTGISSPYEPPLAPDLELRTDRSSVADSAEQLATLAFRLAHPPGPGDAAGADI
jgi:bifunctional enzyme CysN/CysC